MWKRLKLICRNLQSCSRSQQSPGVTPTSSWIELNYCFYMRTMKISINQLSQNQTIVEHVAVQGNVSCASSVNELWHCCRICNPDNARPPLKHHFNHYKSPASECEGRLCTNTLISRTSLVPWYCWAFGIKSVGQINCDSPSRRQPRQISFIPWDQISRATSPIWTENISLINSFLPKLSLGRSNLTPVSPGSGLLNRLMTLLLFISSNRQDVLPPYGLHICRVLLL